ncbi:MAG: hypothetical protein ABIJ34_07075 [archaeon]
MSLNEDELKKEIDSFAQRYTDDSVRTEEFTQFKSEITNSQFSVYEKACNFCSKILTIKADKAKKEPLEEAIDTCHLNTTPDGVAAFAILFPIALILVGSGLSYLITTFLMKGEGTLFFVFTFIIGGMLLIVPLTTLPMMFANNWRLKASNQMVMSVFYVVSYMRHTSNLELAVKFTSEHISPPLSMDFKKMIWDVEAQKFDSIKDSMEHYLTKWKKYNPEFVECMHLIESSLYVTTEKKRIETLEKALSLVLESTYEKMLHYAQNLKSPITALNMLGVILPILGLVILPLVVSFMEGVQWYHISVLYNIFLPIGVWYMGKNILSTRPSGYGQADITEMNPELKKQMMANIKIGKKEYIVEPKWIALAIIMVFLLIGNIPIIMHQILLWKGETFDIIVNENSAIVMSTDPEAIKAGKFTLMGYKEKKGVSVGPYGLGSTLLSLAIPLGIVLGMSYYYTTKTKKLMEIRNKTKELESEFASALFQLGNRVADGLPPELAFNKVSEIMENTMSGKFFDMVTTNIGIGMGVEDAIFDSRHGAINKFPSSLIESSMKVFIESAKKGPDVAAESLINISTYIKEMHRVDERLQDLMAETTSSMQSQINFLTPLISGIVIGLTSMITTILGQLTNQMGTFTQDSGIAGGASGGSILELFQDSIPTYYFQLVVGIYVIEITYILTQMLNTLINGYDPLNEKYLMSLYIKKSGTMYCMIGFVIILLFNIIAASVISGLNVVG